MFLTYILGTYQYGKRTPAHLHFTGACVQDLVSSLLIKRNLSTFSLESYLAKMYKSLKNVQALFPRIPLLEIDCKEMNENDLKLYRTKRISNTAFDSMR